MRRTYAVHVWPQPHFDHLPLGSRAIDALAFKFPVHRAASRLFAAIDGLYHLLVTTNVQINCVKIQLRWAMAGTT